jgi:hypothetical protein
LAWLDSLLAEGVNDAVAFDVLIRTPVGQVVDKRATENGGIGQGEEDSQAESSHDRLLIKLNKRRAGKARLHPLGTR